jgi:PhnB protein
MKSVSPYLNFDGRCREAMAFYQACLGGELHEMTFGEAGFTPPPGMEQRVLHARLVRGPFVLMASDTMPNTPYRQGTDVHLNVDCETVDEVDRLYAALADGGQATMPPHDAFWNSRFGMLVDRFGINWMFNCEQPRPAA